MPVILKRDVPAPIIWDGDTSSLCIPSLVCPSSIFLSIGGLSFFMFVLRYFVFRLYESPKFLMGRGKNALAVETIQHVAAYNGKPCPIQVEHLDKLDETYHRTKSDTTAFAAAKRKLEKFNFTHVRSLYRTKKLAFSTSLTILLWGFIGLAFPLYNAYLPYILVTRGAQMGTTNLAVTYRNTVIIALMGSPHPTAIECRDSGSFGCWRWGRNPSRWS